MNVGVPTVIALLWAIVVSGCAGNEIAPATSAAPAPGNGDPLAALYAAPPAGGAFITVGDMEADIVAAADVPFYAADLLGYGYGAALVVPSVDDPWGAPFADLGLDLAASDAVPPPVDIDAHFAAAIAAAAAVDSPPLVWERGPEMQQPLDGWEAPPLDAK